MAKKKDTPQDGTSGEKTLEDSEWKRNAFGPANPGNWKFKSGNNFFDWKSINI